MPFEPMTVEQRLAVQRQFLERASACTNVGETGDGQDLYTVFEELLETVRQTMPPFACKEGCHHCCRMTPSVTSIEWRVILRHLQEMAPDLRRRIIRKAEALRPMAWLFREARKQSLDPTIAKPLSADSWCPFLQDGGCSIYPARPLKCRGYGYSMGTAGGKAKFYGSLMALLHLQDTFPGQIAKQEVILPAINHYLDLLTALNAREDGDEAFLAQWLWAHVQDGEILAEPHHRLPDDQSGSESG